MIQIASPQIGKEEREAVDRVLRSGIIAQGPEVAKFEEEFAKWCGVKHAVAVSNGTVALDLCLMSLGIGARNGGGANDEVIVTPRSFVASGSVIVNAGATPKLITSPKESNSLPILDVPLINLAIRPSNASIKPANNIAIIAILFAGLMDALAGRIARLIKGTSKMGNELDSLGDVISFGVAPALIMYCWN